MKVVHIITGLNTGGAERALYNLLQGGLSSQFDSYVISLSDAGTMGAQIQAAGVPIIILDMPVGRPTFSGILKLRRVIKELQPDLIQGWMYHGNLAATLARTFLLNKPAMVWNIRQSLYKIENEKWLTRLVIKANRYLSKRPDTLLYNSQLSRQQHEQFGFEANNGLVIPNGIDLEQFNFSNHARQRVRAELAIPTSALVVGHVARFHPMKDHALFLDTAVAIAERHLNIHFLLSGLDVHFDNMMLKQQIPYKLQNKFHLLGERQDVADLMSAMDILISSSWGEAFPNVLGEAMAIGIPCMATDVGDSDLIIGETGVIVPASDRAALIAGLESLLTLSVSERQALGKKARKRVEDKFSLAMIVGSYKNLYKSIFLQKRKI